MATDTDKGLAFLLRHQPMPDDDDLTQDVIDDYDEVRRHFLANPDPRSVPLLLGSFGDGSGWGVYQLVENVFRAHDRALVVDALRVALESPHQGVRNWSLQIAMTYRDRSLVPAVKRSLFAHDLDERLWAAHNLELNYDAAEDAPALRQALSREDDPDVLELLRAIPLEPSQR